MLQRLIVTDGKNANAHNTQLNVRMFGPEEMQKWHRIYETEVKNMYNMGLRRSSLALNNNNVG